MKKVFLALAAVVALAACSKEETLVQQAPEAIAFENAFVDNATRSVNDPSLTTEGLKADDKGFAVFGYVRSTADANSPIAPIFKNEEVKYKNNAWTYGTTQYWIEGAFYNFAAVAPYSVASNTSDATFNYDNINGNFNTTLTFTNDGETDLLYYQTAPIPGKATGNDEVALTFRHTLSKVKFSFTNEYNATNTTIKVRDIKVKNAYKTGKVTLDANTGWSEQTLAANNDFVLDFGEATDNEATTNAKENASIAYASGLTYESQNELLLIPADYDSAKTDDAKRLAVEFTYDIVVNGVTIKSFTETPKVSIELLPGCAYDFKATIKPGEKIEFTAEVNDWDYTNQNQTM